MAKILNWTDEMKRAFPERMIEANPDERIPRILGVLPGLGFRPPSRVDRFIMWLMCLAHRIAMSLEDAEYKRFYARAPESIQQDYSSE